MGSASTPTRESWATRIGFVLAAVGSAVGLGNVWRFPYMTAENGGAAFLVVYLLAVIFIGLPAMLAEFTIGRRANRNVVDAFEGVGHRKWRLVGVLGLFTGFWILSYYSVIGGWVLRYTLGSVSGAYFGDPEAYFTSIATGGDALLAHAVFMGVTVAIVGLGIRRGIELATKVMVPAIVLLLVGLAVWAATLEGAAGGYAYYLTPDFGTLAANFWSIVPDAVGQALFTLSLGMGAMITYASYSGGDTNLGTEALAIVVLNTFVAVLAGFVVFPLLFAIGVDPGQPGPSAIFVSLPGAFEPLPAGRLLGVAFFGVVALAALSSAISLLEVVVSYVVDNYDYGRAAVSLAIGVTVFLLGIPTALNTATLEVYDTIASNLLLPLGVFLIVLFVGWVYGSDAVAELARGTRRLSESGLGSVWLWDVRVVVLAAVIVTLVLSVSNLVGVPISI